MSRTRVARRLHWRRLGVGRALAIALTVLAVGIQVGPIAFVVLGSLMSEAEFRELPRHVVPEEWTLAAYERVIADGSLIRGVRNTAIVAALQVGSILLVGSLGGFVFSRARFRGKEALFLFVLATAMVPFSTLLIPLYLLGVQLGFDNTYLGAVLPAAVSPFAIFLCRVFINAIPRDLFDAAAVDGASDLRIYVSVVLPLIRPQLAVLGLFALEASVNALLWPIVILNDPNMETLAMALLQYVRTGLTVTPFTETLAAAVLASIPMVVVLLVLQRQFARGIGLTDLVGR